jgi:2-haloalkanoic acid dehalogenase type II
MTRSLRDFRVLSFDCYGTLIDWETGIWGSLQPLFAANDTTPERASILAAFAELETDIERENPRSPYPEILQQVHRSLATRFHLETSETLDEGFGHAVPKWLAFSDSYEALTFLGTHYRLVVLSNVDRAGIAASLLHLPIGFDGVYTAEDIGFYKPEPACFEYLIDRVETDFEIGSGEILHVAQSLYHDHVPARQIGLATAWIDRQGLSRGGSWGATAVVDEPPTPDFTFMSMAELAQAVDKGL